MIEQPLQYSLIPRESNSRLEFLILCDCFTRVWSEILVDRIKHYLVYDEQREPRAFCASSHFSLSTLSHSYLSYLIFQVRQFLDSFKRDGELRKFMTSFSETAMFAEVIRAKANSMRKQGTSPSHLPWDIGCYQDRGLRRTPENPMSVMAWEPILPDLRRTHIRLRSESLIQRIKRRTNPRAVLWEANFFLD